MSDQNINNVDRHDWTRDVRRMAFGYDGSSFNILHSDESGRGANKQYVWDTDTLSWVAGNSAGGVIGGGGTTSTTYQLLMDDTGTVLYVGESLPGTATNAASWRIKRVTDTSVKYADGITSFTKVWDNRTSYGY